MTATRTEYATRWASSRSHGRLLRRQHHAREGQLPDQRPAPAPRVHPRPSADQAAGALSKSRAGIGSTRTFARRRIIRAAQDVIDGALDRVSFIVDVFQTGADLAQHERQRGDRQRAIELARRRSAARGPRCTPTTIQPRAVEQRCDSRGDPLRRGGLDTETPSRVEVLEALVAAQVRGVLAGDQDGPHPSPGRDAHPARSGFLGYAGQMERGAPALRGAIAALAELPLGDRGRTGRRQPIQPFPPGDRVLAQILGIRSERPRITSAGSHPRRRRLGE